MKTKYPLAAIVIGFVVSLASDANAQTPSFQWAKRVASTIDSDNELSIGLAIDSVTNVYVTGWFDGTNDFGGTTLTNLSGGGQDIFLAKYNSTGALQRAQSAGGSTSDRDAGRGVAVDTNGNVYLTGGFYGPADFGPSNFPAYPYIQFFIAKADHWTQPSVGGYGVYGTGLAVDGSGNSYAVGYANNGAPITFGTTNLLNTNFDGYSTFLVKYDNAGSNQWAQLMGGPGHTYATKVAVDATGNVYVRGAFSTNMTIGTSNLVSSTAGSDMFIAKFDNSGALTWVRQTTGADVDEGGVAVDQAGNVYVTGWYDGGSLHLDGATLTNAGSLDAFVAKYNSSGTIQWARRAGGTNFDFYWDCALDQQGNVYVAGVLGSGAVAPSGSGAMVAKYDPSGTLQWVISASGPSASPIASVAAKCAIDSAGNCYLAGWYRTNTTFGTNVLQPQGYWNYFLAKVGFTPLTLGIAWSNAMPRLSVFGGISNRFVLEYVSALAASNSWQSLVTNTLTSNPFIVTDTNAGGNLKRFYRARLVP